MSPAKGGKWRVGNGEQKWVPGGGGSLPGSLLGENEGGIRGGVMNFARSRFGWLDRWDVVLAVIALAGCLLMIGLFPRNPVANDGAEYDAMARNILAGHGYSLDGVSPDARRPPGYTLFVAFVYFFVGPRPLAVVALQVLLTMATPVVFRRVLTGIGLDHRHALVGSVACVLYIFPYIYVQQLITEPLTTFLVVVGAAVATRTWTIGFSAPGQAFLAGMLCALPALVKSQHATLAGSFALFGVWTLVRQRSGRPRAMLGVAAFLLGVFLMIAPWGARNLVQFGSPHLLGKGMPGQGLLYAQFEARGRWLLWTFWKEEYSGSLPTWKEYDEKRRAAYEAGSKAGMDPDEIKMALALREIRDNPLEALRAYVVRAYSLWIMIPTSKSETVRMVSVLVEIAILLAALTGLWLHRHLFKPRGFPLALFIGSQAVLLPIITIEARYGVSLKPFLLAGVGMLGLLAWDRFHRRSVGLGS